MKRFVEQVRSGVVRKVSANIERAKSLENEAARKRSSLEERIEKIGIRDGNANDYVENCYDIILILIRAKLYHAGYLCSGQGAHEAEVAYLLELGFPENDVQFLDQLRYLRNGILYYGTSLDAEYALKVVAFMRRVYPKLLKSMRRGRDA